MYYKRTRNKVLQDLRTLYEIFGEKVENLLASKMRPGSSAEVALTKPLPMSKGVAGDWFTSGLE